MPKLLVTLYHGRRIPVRVHEQFNWAGTACDVCARRLDHDHAVFLMPEGQGIRCRFCVSLPPPRDCVWCGAREAKERDTGDRMCRDCWRLYVADVADVVESGAFRDLMADAHDHVAEVMQAREEWDAAAPGEDRPS